MHNVEMKKYNTNSTFTLKEKIEFHKKKWLKEHIFEIALCIIAWLVVIVALKLQNAEGYLIGTWNISNFFLCSKI